MNRLTNFERAAVLAVFAVCTLLVIGAAATRNKYVGTFVGDGNALTNMAASAAGAVKGSFSNGLNVTAINSSNVFQVRTTNATLALQVVTNADLRVGGDAYFDTGDVTMEGSSTFLQMNATGNGTGYRYFDFYNGADKLQLRRKSDNGSTVLANILTVSNDVSTFGGAVVASAFTGDGAGLTNITTSSTNAVGATYATNDAAGTAILMANKLNTTNGSAVNTLMVIGADTGDPPVFIARASSAQATNAILDVQASDQRKLFSIGSQGAVQLGTNVLANWPTAAHTHGGAAFCNSNGTVYLLISGPNSTAWTSTNKIAP